MTLQSLLTEPNRVDEPRVAQEYSEVLSQVAAEGKPLIVRRNGADLAAVVPLEYLELLRKSPRGRKSKTGPHKSIGAVCRQHAAHRKSGLTTPTIRSSPTRSPQRDGVSSAAVSRMGGRLAGNQTADTFQDDLSKGVSTAQATAHVEDFQPRQTAGRIEFRGDTLRQMLRGNGRIGKDDAQGVGLGVVADPHVALTNSCARSLSRIRGVPREPLGIAPSVYHAR